MIPKSSRSPVGFEAEPNWLSPSSQLTRKERLGQERVFGADQAPSADMQGSAASDASSLMGNQLSPPPQGKRPSQVSIKDLGKQALCLGHKEKRGQVLGT